MIKNKIFSLLILGLLFLGISLGNFANAEITSDNACTAMNGVCYDSNTTYCSSGYIADKCAGSASRKCCTSTATPISNTTATASSNCSVTIFGQPVDTCSLDGMVGLGLVATKFILGMVGSVALLAFVWGGFQMILAAGDSGKVKKGRDSITAAVIGLVIVFTSYILVQFIMENLLGVK